jgi:hypothetical protein
MNLYPQDLRERLHAEVIRRRSNAGQPVTEDVKEDVTPQLGRLGRLWSRGLSLTPKQAAVAMPATATTTQSIAWLTQFLSTFLAGFTTMVLAKKGIISSPQSWEGLALFAGAMAYPSFVALPRAALKSLYKKPVSVAEVEYLLSKAQTDLERSYLGLLRHAILQPVPDEAQDDVRTAILSLGEAVDALPLIDPAQTNTKLLREEAAVLQSQSAIETDTIIAESLENQAEATLRRADAADRSVQYTRRIAALRKEIAAQIAAVQEDLSTFNSTSGTVIDGLSLSHLAEGAQRVATISVNAANARAELDSFSDTVPSTTLPAHSIPSSHSIPTAEEQPVQKLQVTIK